MRDALRQLGYKARMMLARGGRVEMIDVAGRKTQLRHGGEGAPFFYLHSALGECAWLPFLESWSRRFEVFAPAHPGFALSEGIDEIDSIEDYCFHYVDLLDTLCLKKVLLGGVSLGGWIAVEFASRWPERVERLWLADAPGLWLEEWPLFDLFRHAQNPARLREAMFFEANGFPATAIIKEMKERSKEEFLAAYQSMAALARLVWERPYNPKLAGRLRRISCPALILWGDADRLVPTAYAREYQRLIAGAELEILPRCGHFPMFEQESAFTERVASFCAAGGSGGES